MSRLTLKDQLMHPLQHCEEWKPQVMQYGTRRSDVSSSNGASLSRDATSRLCRFRLELIVALHGNQSVKRALTPVVISCATLILSVE